MRTRRWRSNSGGRTCRLAIFRVHSVAKPQLTALLGSYSFSRPLASSLLHPALLLFRFLFSSHFSFASALPLFFSSVFTRPTVSPLVRPLLIFFFLALTAVFLFFSFPSSLYHTHTHVFFLSLAPSPLNSFVFFCSTRFFGISSRAFVSLSRLFFACVCYEEFPFAQPRISELNNDIYIIRGRRYFRKYRERHFRP